MNRPLIYLFPFLLLTACRPDGADTLFTSLSPEKTGLHFSNDLTEDEHFNIIKYLYFYNGGGVAIGDVNNDGLPDIYLSANQLPDRLFINRGDMKFEDVTKRAGLLPPDGKPGKSWKTGVTMADVNADGWLDIYVCEVGFYKSVSGRNRLFINQKDGTFKEEAKKYGLAFRGFSQQAAFFDFDLDGDLDCFLLNHSTHSADSFSPAANRSERDAQAGDRLYQNNGPLGFTDVSEEAGIFGGPMGYGLGVVISDFNSDGWPDIYVTNDFHENDYLYINAPAGEPHPPSGGKGGARHFREVIATATGHTSTFSMGVDAADLNNDGLPDVMALDMQPDSFVVERASAGADHYNLQQMKLGQGYHFQFPVNSLQLADGGGHPDEERIGMAVGGKLGVHFHEIAHLAGVASTDWSWGPLLADFDLDGWKDIFITNGIWRRPNDLDYLRFASDAEVKRQATDQELAAKMPSGKAANFAYRMPPPAPPKGGSAPRVDSPPLGGQGGAYEDVSKAWGLDLHGCSNGAAYADLDLDGDLDLVVNNLNAPASVFENHASQKTGHNYLRIKLIGNQKNFFGIGAKVVVKAGGMEQTQELSPSRGWLSSSGHVLVFGLSANAEAEEVRVIWPGGWQQVLTDVKANQTLSLQAVDAVEKAPEKSSPETIFRPLSPPPVSHAENRFTDFNVEPLMPWLMSTQGPKMDWADFENGVTGLYVCGAKGQPGQFLERRPGEGWAAVPQPGFEKDFLSEDVSAAFFDADGDGDMDLYVVSGGGEYREGAAPLRDRFYENRPSPSLPKREGGGGQNFVKRENALPGFAVNGSFVLPFDFDGDMDIDLFVGSRSVPGSFGLPPKSFILKNDLVEAGQIHFTDVTETLCPQLSGLGMTTSATWLWREQKLVIVGEWMAPQIIDFSQSPAVSLPIPNPQSPITKSGLWQTIEAADFDGDGDLDLLAGNMGLNTPLTASPEEPLELFAKDFDGNGAIDPIVTWYREGKRYPIVSKDALDRQLPFLRKKYPGYRQFAEAGFDKIFDEKMREGAVHSQVTELRSMYFENLGDGQFEATPLPLAAQSSPIFAFLPGDFDGDGHLDALAVGNFHGLRPELGKADASFGYFLKGDGKGNFTVLPSAESGFFVSGEGRDLVHVQTADGEEYIIVARNGAPLLFFR